MMAKEELNNHVSTPSTASGIISTKTRAPKRKKTPCGIIIRGVHGDYICQNPTRRAQKPRHAEKKGAGGIRTPEIMDLQSQVNGS